MKEFDLIVIGSGPGGYVAAIRAAQLGLKTACIEKSPYLGGTCLNIGCIPSKALLYSTELYAKLQSEYALHGIKVKGAEVDFATMMARKVGIVSVFQRGIVGLFKKNQITPFFGIGQLLSSTTVSVEGDLLSSKNILLATGSEPISLPFLPVDEERIVTSTGALSLTHIPKHLVVIGAGAIGVELGSVYKRLGSQVTFVEFLDRVCPTLDLYLSKSFQRILEKQGLAFRLGAKVKSVQYTPVSVTLFYEREGKEESIEGDVILVSIGRRPFTQNLGLEKLGIIPNAKGFIPINGRFQTIVPSIYAIGDLVDGPMLAHKASEEGIAVAEIIAGLHPTIQYMAIPNVIYTSPEVATVGLTEEETKQLGLQIKVGLFPFKTNSRAKCTGEEEGFVKVIAEAQSDRLLGVHILGAHASELIAEAVLAMQKKLTALELAQTPHAHPTLSEALKEAALAVHKRAIH